MNKKIKYALMALALLGLFGCNQRTILIQPGEVKAPQPPKIQPTVKEPEIKEEILINKNPQLGNAIPDNNPSLGAPIEVTTEEYVVTEEQQAQEAPMNNGIIQRIAFPVSEYNRIKKTGGSTVSGTVYLQNNHNGEKIMGKKVKLYLNPVTSYSRQWYQQSYLGGYKLSKSDKRLYNYLKYTVSNVSGKFNFFGLAPGSYYLVGAVTCAQECGYSEQKTIRLVREVYVGNGVANVNLMKHVP